MWKNAYTEKSRLILSKQGNPSSGNEKKKKNVECSSNRETSAEEKPSSSGCSGPTQLYLLSEKGDSFKQKGEYQCLRGLMVRGAAIHQHCEYKSLIHHSRRLLSYSSEIASGPTSNTKYINLGEPRRQHSSKSHLLGIE